MGFCKIQPVIIKFISKSMIMSWRLISMILSYICFWKQTKWAIERNTKYGIRRNLSHKRGTRLTDFKDSLSEQKWRNPWRWLRRVSVNGSENEIFSRSKELSAFIMKTNAFLISFWLDGIPALILLRGDQLLNAAQNVYWQSNSVLTTSPTSNEITCFNLVKNPGVAIS